MNKEKVFSLIRELFAPVALILLGALLLFNPDSASALISKLLGWIIVICAIGFGVTAIVDPGKRTGKAIAAVALAMVGGWLMKNPLALAAWVGRIVGILLAVFAVIGLNPDISGILNLGNIGGLVFFGLLLASFVFFANKAAKETK